MPATRRVHLIRAGVAVLIAATAIVIPRGGVKGQDAAMAPPLPLPMNLQQMERFVAAVEKKEGLGRSIGEVILGSIGTALKTWDIVRDEEEEFSLEESSVLVLSVGLLGGGIAGIVDYFAARKELEDPESFFMDDFAMSSSARLFLDSLTRPQPVVVMTGQGPALGIGWRFPIAP